MEILHNEQLATHESVMAREMFVDAAEMQRLTEEAMVNGTITTSLATPEDNGWVHIVPGISLTSEEVDVRQLSAQDRAFKQGKFDEMPISKPDVAMAKTLDFINTRVKDTAINENQWHLNEPLLKKDLEEGKVSELYEFSIGGEKKIVLVNFTDRLLTEEQLTTIHEVIKKMTALSGGANFLKTNAICIQKAERFKDDVVGTARGLSGAILLNEKLLDGSFEEGDFKFADIGVSPLESTLTHESMHLIEINGDHHLYGDATGWQSRHEKLVDDYGNAIDVNREVLGAPLVAEEIVNGAKQKVSLIGKYGLEKVLAARPVTGYGYKNDREDLAEAAVPYVYTDRDDYDSLDVIRRDAVTKVLQGAAAEYGPFNVTKEKLSLTTKIGGTIKPRNFIVAEPRYTYMEMKEKNNNAYTTHSNTFMDDYGNEQTTYNKHVPKTS